MPKKRKDKPQFGHVRTVKELGILIRAFRKNQGVTLEKVSGLTNIGMRFLSELERGKETIQLGKALATLNNLGLDMIILPRGSFPPRPIVKNKEDE
jgi:HTH-type transcriptional regulator / antitoxin HipB